MSLPSSSRGTRRRDRCLRGEKAGLAPSRTGVTPGPPDVSALDSAGCHAGSRDGREPGEESPAGIPLSLGVNKKISSPARTLTLARF